MPLLRLLLVTTVVFALGAEVVMHLPHWALNTLGCIWLAVLAAAGYDAWRNSYRDRAAQRERERFGTAARR